MAVREVKVPDLGDFEDVPVIDVLVHPGDTVAVEDPLVTLESDKATMDVPSSEAGTIEELKVNVGDTVSTGTVLLTISVNGDGAGGDEEAADGEAEADQPGAESGAADAATAETSAEAGRPEEIAKAEQAESESAPEAAEEPQEDGAEAPPEAAADGDGPIYASPSVRRLARERGVDLAALTGTGRKGRITVEDVEAAAGDGAAAPAGAGVGGLEMAPWPKIDFSQFGEIEVVELSRIKRIAGPNLVRNWVHIPHVTHHDEADITDLEAFRKQLNAEQDVKVTMVSLVMLACVATLKEFPEVNASLDGDHLVLKRYYHLGFAADTPQGLLVPVIRDVDKKGLLEIAAELRDLSGRAREGKLKLAEMQGGTFTISSLGGIGGTGFTPIVNAPEVAILGVTRAAMKPVWNGSEFEPRLMVPLSLSYDHRVVDGAEAARFTAHLATVLSDLKRALL
jgi:pyruvate dehydrogenase E2 component (dihydrolipoamide acetyltransferase)